MKPPHFWKLIGLLDGVVDGPGLGDLADAVEAMSQAQQDAFADHLHSRLRRLAKPPLRESVDAWLEENEGTSDENVMYLASAVVAAGREVYEQVVADPARLEDHPWDLGAEDLLWSLVPEPPEADGDDWWPADADWLNCSLGVLLAMPVLNALGSAMHTVPQWPRWLQWRADRGIRLCVLILDFGQHDRSPLGRPADLKPAAPAKVTKHAPDVLATARFSPDQWPDDDTDPAAWIPIMEEALERIAPMVRRPRKKKPQP